MTFLALLTKELRLRLRRERTIWVIIAYLLVMGLLGWLSINSYSSNSYYSNSGLSTVGLTLYTLLSQLQLFLIIFITPAFTSTAVNSEKERQTFDLLLCSRLSAFSLVSGKLLAGLTNALLLIAASAPLFSLVFFFGGVSPTQVLKALLIFLSTAIVVGCFGLFCSTFFKRPAVSTAVSYMACLLWIGLPMIISFILLSSPATRSVGVTVVNGGIISRPLAPPTTIHMPLWLAWNPLIALNDTYPTTSGIGGPGFNPLLSIYASSAYVYGGPGGLHSASLGNWVLAPWQLYLLLNIVASVLFFLLSMWAAKPGPMIRLRKWLQQTYKEMLSKETTAPA